MRLRNHEKMRETWSLYLLDVPFTRIAKRVAVDRRTVSRWVADLKKNPSLREQVTGETECDGQRAPIHEHTCPTEAVVNGA